MNSFNGAFPSREANQKRDCSLDHEAAESLLPYFETPLTGTRL